MSGLLIVELNPMDWCLIALATAIIWAILGKRLMADVRQWRRGRASSRKVDGGSSE